MPPSEPLEDWEAAPPPPAPPPPQGADWQRLHPMSPLLRSLTTAARFWPVFLIAVFNEGGGAGAAAIIGGGAAVVIVIETVRYLRFDYRLEGTTLVVRSGVMVRRTRTVPADRVQQVSHNQKLRHRLFAVAEVLVEVAGSGSEPDVTLSVVTADEAKRIRTRLQDARREVGAQPPDPERVIYEQPNRSLLRWAAFASPLFMLPVIGAGVGALGDAVDLEEAWAWLPDGTELWFLASLGLLGLAAATGVNLARFYDMRLVQADDTLRLEYGLLTHRRLELPVERIQALVTKLTPAGVLAGTVGITAHNASSAGETTNSYLPAIPRADRPVLSGWLIPELAADAALIAHPRAALRRSLIRWMVPALAVTAVVVILQRGWLAWAVSAVVPLAGFIGWRAWRLLGHALTPDVIVARRGAITGHNTAIRRSRVQSVSYSANWFQRRLGLATLQVEVAQPLGRVTIRDMDGAEAAGLAGAIVPQI